MYGDSEKPDSADLELLKNKKIELNTLILEKTTDNANLRNVNKTTKELEESEICPLCKRNLDDVDHSNEIKKLKTKITTLTTTIDKNNKLIEKLEKSIDLLESKKIVFYEYEKEIIKKRKIGIRNRAKRISYY